MFYRNDGIAPQLYYAPDGRSILVPSKFAVDDCYLRGVKVHHLNPCEPLEKFLEKHPTSCVAIFRTFALGDVLQALVVARFILSNFLKSTVLFYTRAEYLPVLEHIVDDRFYVCNSAAVIPGKKIDIGYNLDRTLERDHSGDKRFHQHRVRLFLDALGFSFEGN